MENPDCWPRMANFIAVQRRSLSTRGGCGARSRNSRRRATPAYFAHSCSPRPPTPTCWTRQAGLAAARLRARREWLNVRTPSWLEGNAVVTPSGAMVDILRVESHQAAGGEPGIARVRARNIPRFEAAAMLEISADGREAHFEPARGFIHFIGGESKFTIRFDPVSRRYWSLANKITNRRSGERLGTQPASPAQCHRA